MSDNTLRTAANPAAPAVCDRGAPFLMRLAELTVAVETCPGVPGFERFAAAYASPAAPGQNGACCDLRVTVTPADIDRERAAADRDGYSDAYLQTLAVYRQIAEQAPARGCFLMHAAVVAYEGRAYAFTAPSGTGKSTHVRLWRKELGTGVTVINGDKPLVRMERHEGGMATFTAHGTPWAGKENWSTNTSAPLAGLCLVRRGVENTCTRIEPAAALDRMLRQVYLPRDPQAALLTLDFLDALLRDVPLYNLECTVSPDAVRASFEAMVGHPLPTR